VKGHGPREERETVIVFSEGDDEACIWTASEVVYRRMLKRGWKPVDDSERHAEFNVPRDRIKLPTKRKRTVTPEQIERLKQTGFKNRGKANEQRQVNPESSVGGGGTDA
jgi:hypothetical protein